MKEESILLDSTQRQQFKQLLQLTKIKKNWLSEAIDMQSSGLSEATSVFGHRRIPIVKWQKLLEVIKTELDSRLPKNQIERPKYNQVINILNQLEGKNTIAAESLNGPLSSEATNYVQRDSDVLLQQRIDNNIAYFWIHGGIKKGKSSLLVQARKACEEKGIQFHLCDFKQLSGIESVTQSIADIYCYKNIFQFLFRQTTGSEYQFLESEFNELADEFKTAFKQWKNGATRPGQEFFVAIDHLDCLLDPLIQDDDVSGFIRGYDPAILIHFILQAFLSLSRELSQIRFALVLEDYLYVSAKVSPLISQASPIQLKSLTNEEILRLWDKIKPAQSGIALTHEHALIIKNKIGGNPYLIQCLLRDIANDGDAEKPLLAYIDQMKKRLLDNKCLVDLTDDAQYCYPAKVMSTLQKIAALSQKTDDFGRWDARALMADLKAFSKSKMNLNLQKSFAHLGFIDESNQLMPIIALIVNQHLPATTEP